MLRYILCLLPLTKGTVLKPPVIRVQQFLFIPHIYQLIAGKTPYVRLWCAWEMGCFYGTHRDDGNQLYYVDIVSNRNYGGFIEGFKPANINKTKACLE
jgi:hypothetical protein